MGREKARFGSWSSPITPSMITATGISISQIATDGESLHWLENRPLEHGRGVVVRSRRGQVEELTTTDFNVRTRVHEYGGGSFWMHEGTLFFANFSDQRPLPALGRRSLHADHPRARYAGGRPLRGWLRDTGRTLDNLYPRSSRGT